MKQEAIEDATENSFLANKLENSNAVEKANYIAGFREGVKWQQENSNENALDFEIDALKKEIKVLKHQQEKLCDSEVIQRIRASKSDAEARRIIKTI